MSPEILARRLAAPLAADILRVVADHAGCTPADLAGTPAAVAAFDAALGWIRVWVQPPIERPTPVVDMEALIAAREIPFGAFSDD